MRRGAVLYFVTRSSALFDTGDECMPSAPSCDPKTPALTEMNLSSGARGSRKERHFETPCRLTQPQRSDRHIPLPLLSCHTLLVLSFSSVFQTRYPMTQRRPYRLGCECVPLWLVLKVAPTPLSWTTRRERSYVALEDSADEAGPSSRHSDPEDVFQPKNHLQAIGEHIDKLDKENRQLKKDNAVLQDHLSSTDRHCKFLELRIQAAREFEEQVHKERMEKEEWYRVVVQASEELLIQEQDRVEKLQMEVKSMKGLQQEMKKLREAIKSVTAAVNSVNST